MAVKNDKPQWETYTDYPHLKTLTELQITFETLPEPIKQKIRGFDSGKKNVSTQNGFEGLVKLSSQIADWIIDFHETGIEKTEEEYLEQVEQEQKDKDKKEADRLLQQNKDDEDKEILRLAELAEKEKEKEKAKGGKADDEPEEEKPDESVSYFGF